MMVRSSAVGFPVISILQNMIQTAQTIPLSQYGHSHDYVLAYQHWSHDYKWPVWSSLMVNAKAPF